MKTFFKKIIPFYLFYLFLVKMYRRLRDKIVIPDYETKRKIILNTAKKYNYTRVFVETGTYMGDTIESLKYYFDELYSIELNKDLALKAIRRFISNSKVKIVHGDSTLELSFILSAIKTPIVFWLDGHYSSEFWVGDQYIITAKGDKETPVLEELSQIANHAIKNHVILIDDARLFIGKGDYPNMKQLISFIEEKFPSHTIIVKKDIIRILPKQI